MRSKKERCKSKMTDRKNTENDVGFYWVIVGFGLGIVVGALIMREPVITGPPGYLHMSRYPM